MLTIKEPGKFQGEPWFVRDVLWPMMMDGASDLTIYDGETPIDVFDLTPALCLEYELPADTAVVLIWEQEDGFVCSRFLTAERWARLQDTLDAENGDDTDQE